MQLQEVKKSSSNKSDVKKNGAKFFANNKTDIIIGAVLVLFIIYSVVTLISQQVNIGKKTAELNDIKSQIIIEEVKNEEINDILDSSDSENTAYIEKSAREDLDYAYNDERIFINISGD